ncbi:hypothetical protein BaRGS_00022358 [Batillaria attramentaria]|uniref:Uncharacterized protein n=1 Tax=Batillaria attramentaria TaxID=370345 RepID=A0ABD0KH36_9CAEN
MTKQNPPSFLQPRLGRLTNSSTKRPRCKRHHIAPSSPRTFSGCSPAAIAVCDVTWRRSITPSSNTRCTQLSPLSRPLAYVTTVGHKWERVCAGIERSVYPGNRTIWMAVIRCFCCRPALQDLCSYAEELRRRLSCVCTSIDLRWASAFSEEM